MKTCFKFIYFEPCDIDLVGVADVDNSAQAFACRNNKSRDLLGYIVRYRRWRRYVLVSEPDAVFSMDCLADIKTFVAGIIADKER